MNSNLYRDVQSILRAPWLGPVTKKTEITKADVPKTTVTGKSSQTNFLANRKQKMVQNEQQMQYQDSIDSEKIRKDLSEW